MRAVSLLFHDVYVRRPDESGFSSPGADRYKLPIAAFDAQLDGVASVRADAPVLATDLARPPASNAIPFVITVDDGGLSYYTEIADRLEARGWRGHCFVSTDLIGRDGFLSARQIQELDARGHVIGSHSASHPARFSSCDAAQMRQEWSQSRAVLEDLLGHRVTVASVPGGYFSRAVAERASETGIQQLFTSEPTTTVEVGERCTVIGRFAIRHGDPDDFACRLVLAPPWTRAFAWASWNAKGLVKPILGSTYARLADCLLSSR